MRFDFKVYFAEGVLFLFLTLGFLLGNIFYSLDFFYYFIFSGFYFLFFILSFVYFKLQIHLTAKVDRLDRGVVGKLRNFENEFDSLHLRLGKEIGGVKEEIKEIIHSELKQDIEENLGGMRSEMRDNFVILLKAMERKVEENSLEVKDRLDLLDKNVRELYDSEIVNWNKVELDRVKKLWKLAPDLFRQKSVLYVGARDDRFFLGKEFAWSKMKVDVLEIYKPNVKFLKGLDFVNQVIEGDVTKFKPKKKYDVIFWWHGPEHVTKAQMKKTLKVLEKSANKMVVLGTPWGEVKQGPEYENPYEKHKSFYEKEDFEKLGYRTLEFGKKNFKGSTIIAVKRVENKG